MFHEICIGLYLGFTLNNIETFAKPVEVLKPILPVLPFQLVNVSNLLAYQGFDSNDNSNLNEAGRKKRFLDDLMNLFSWLEDYEDESEENDTDEDDSSKEEETSGEKIGEEGHDICCNCYVTINKVKQVQHLYHDTHKMPSNESPIINLNKTQDNSKFPIAEENIQSNSKNQEKSIMDANKKPTEAKGPSNAAAPTITKAKSPAEISVPAERPALTEIPAVAKAPAPVDSPAKAPALAKPLAPQEVPTKKPAPAKVTAELPAPAEISTKAAPPTEASVTVPVPSEAPAKAEASAKTEAPATGSTEAQQIIADNNEEVPVAPEAVDGEAPEIPVEAPITTEAEKEEQTK